VPAYDGNDIKVFDGASGALVRAISGQLIRPRVVLFEPDSTDFLVSVFGAGDISRYKESGEFDQFVTQSFASVTGLAYRKDGALFAISSTNGRARTVNPTSGEIGNLFTESAGVSSATFITFIDFSATEPVNSNQLWGIGVGNISGLSITIETDSFLSASGGAFGDAFDPEAIELHPHGSIIISLKSCTEAALIYNTDDGANIGSGSYDLVKLGRNSALAECLDTGFDEATTSQNALTGAWYGGPTRDGEGFFVDTLDNGTAIVTWFTYGAAIETTTN
jgi:hypothetical protein